MEKAKMTYVNALETVLAGAEMTDEVREKLEALKASLIKRNTKTGERKPTKAQKENAELKAQILDYMTNDYTEPVKAGEIATSFGISVQKASPLLNQMVEAGLLVKGTGEKRSTVFSVAKAE